MLQIFKPLLKVPFVNLSSLDVALVGSHIITLTVIDDTNLSNSATKNLNITISPVKPPKLSFYGSTTVDVNRTANFSVTSDKSKY